MDNSRRSLAPGEDSISMYLSFDAEADDTHASKWQSVMATQTTQYLEMHSMELDPKHDDTLEEKKKDVKNVLQALIKNDISKDQASPLRPFDKSILNKHNALCSTPTKNITLSDVHQDVTATDADNKENTQPDEENSTLSSTIDATASTVKTNTIYNATLEDNSVKENNNKTNIYPLSANVVLENITEVSTEEPSVNVPSPLTAVAQDRKDTEIVVSEMVNEVSELIVKALKLTDGSTKPEKQTKLPTLALPRPRRSYLPTANGTTFKQRMSIVVKTTLNSPARKLATGNPIARRSCLPAAKTSLIGNAGYRKSMLPRSAESATIKASTSRTAQAAGELADEKARPIIHKFKCQLCSASFREKNSLDTHMDSHWKCRPAIRNKNSFFCKYCDKKFVLERALHIHLMQNCDKIPPGEKRKLQFTELNHEKKAKLPKLTCTSPAVSSESLKSRESMMPVMEKEQPIATNGGTKGVEMAPPSVKKIPKKVAHAGVYRTPTKSVPCHTCKQSFKSILEYTNHCLTVHSKNKKQNTANALSARYED
ncbi:uncharacterized protein [Drosophila virilis]|uniref:C2H2-type domain-containing protein n=1 Tax=Drosophila virilis TaxID=7244 RepID=B4LYY1_DROVI|nr:uncharacterized protein LOC6630045 [Drosophila virilis]EDW68084.1 uncharacterized protein Dvir_GJ22740 [Drosophila virilis]